MEGWNRVLGAIRTQQGNASGTVGTARSETHDWCHDLGSCARNKH